MAINDNQKSERIARHIVQIMKGEQCDDGKAEFDAWLENNHYSHDTIRRMTDQLEFDHNLDSYGSGKVNNAHQQIMNRIDNYQRKQRLRKMSYYCAASVAAMLVVLLVVFRNPDRSSTTEKISRVEHPMIILGNGQRINLSSGDTKSVLSCNSILHDTSTNSISVYGGDQSSAASINKLLVPNLQTYTIVLSDGTVVYLNCDTQLDFPNKFQGNTREVRIQGEAYFKVAKDAEKPFIVRYKDVAIEVYGTQFNINTHRNNVLETVLVEGSIGMQTQNGSYLKIKPNEKAMVDMRTREVLVESVDVSYYTAWRDNNFAFNATTLNRAVEEISRWYGVKIRIDTATDALVTGIFNRNTPLQEIIHSLEVLTNVKLKIEGHDIN